MKLPNFFETLTHILFLQIGTEHADEYDRGIVFYQDKNKVVVGILLWNIFNHMSVARRVVAENRKFDDLTEVAKLFNMYKGISKENSTD